MNKYRMFLGRISPEICLKMDYFGDKFQKNRQALEGPPCIRRLRSQTLHSR